MTMEMKMKARREIRSPEEQSSTIEMADSEPPSIAGWRKENAMRKAMCTQIGSCLRH